MACSSELLYFVCFEDWYLFAENVGDMTYDDVSQQRLQLFHLFNGDVFYPARKWPANISKLFWQKPLSDKSTFELFLFLVCNGCPPQMAGHWILLSQYWSKKALKKRFFQLKFLANHFHEYRNRWFYFDIHFNNYRFISGKPRCTTSDKRY